MSDRQPSGCGDAAITGIGMATPLGHDFETVADALLAGRSGVCEIDPCGATREPRQFAAPVKALPDLPLDPPPCDRLELLCTTTAMRALADAGLTPGDGCRVGIVLGQGAEQLKGWEADFLAGGRTVFEGPHGPTIVQRIASRLGLTGPAVSVAAACASSGYAIAMARAWIATGLVDAVLAGGCDVISPLGLAAFYNLRALSRRGDDPERASRPFDRDRDGFVMGEGGAVFVLESPERAQARAATPRGLVSGVGTSSDASHMVAPCEDPTQAARAIRLAMADAGITPEEIDYINAHAAGTPVGDAAEAAAIRLALGEAADSVPVSSTKGLSGHLVSGASAFEVVACLTAFARDAIPATANLEHPDDRCRLDHVAVQARPARVRTAVSNSFGFGGANLAVVLRAA